MPVEHDFDLFWASYPRRDGKGAARRKFVIALTKTDFHIIMDAVEAQKIAGMFPDNRQFVPHPATWLHQERWDDEIVRKARPTFRNGALELLAREFGDPQPLTIEASN